MGDLYAARGELFTDLFERAWSLLDEGARRILLVATFFPTSANGEALSISSDVQHFAFDRAIERLSDMALLDMQQKDLNSPVRYVLHPLVRAFACARLADHPELEESARKRWIQWALNLSSQVGYCWNDIQKLDLIEDEHETIFFTIFWCYKNNKFDEVMKLANNVGFFFQVRFGWRRRLELDQIYLDVAEKIHSNEDILVGLLRVLEGLSRTGQLAQAKQIKERISKDFSEYQISSKNRQRLKKSFGVYYMCNQNYRQAITVFENFLDNENDVSDSRNLINRRWLADAYLAVGRKADAKMQFNEIINLAERLNYTRMITYIKTQFAHLSIDEKDYDLGSALLKEAESLANACKDRQRLARIKYLTGRKALNCGGIVTARGALLEAIDLFERLGMSRDLAEAREALRELQDHALEQ
ncbi:MAG: hypothetical protein EI684_05850 [Candidatus Viridilinea halotolerans]|uniref:Tetratricopeptide repeat protein n=1 Tax=Candidatus Viridilinea halotolerans TaxID=2491704 RepID=A0A426U4W4_9CHLR|nr:MAG: hypothetical protein EI684_05850 [Candidatus Viridilinea halotolerans]